MAEFKIIDLFGGAATCEIPTTWIDVSHIRTVPSHQEVFVDQSEDKNDSVIIEILQHESAIEDAVAGSFFFNDLAAADSATSSSIDPSKSVVDRSSQFLGASATKVYVEGVQQLKGKSGRPSLEPDHVAVFMTVIRSAMFDADVLVTTHSVVDVFGPESCRKIHEKISNSLVFTDPSLFG